MIIPNVGDAVNILINPGHTPTTATIVSVDPVRRLCVLTHSSGALTNKTSTMHLDHIRAQNDFQVARPVGALWV